VQQTKRFWNNFRSNDWKAQRFVFLFAFWYNFVWAHSQFDRPPGDVTEWLQEVMPQLSQQYLMFLGELEGQNLKMIFVSLVWG